MGKLIIVLIIVGILVLFSCCGLSAIFIITNMVTSNDQITSQNRNNVIEDTNNNDFDYDYDNQNLDQVPTTLPLPNRASEDCLVTSQTQLPTSWPDDFPIFAGAQITSVRCAPNDSDLFEVRMLADGSVTDIDAYYDNALSSYDWTTVENIDNDTYNTYSAYMLLTAEKMHPNLTRQVIIDIRQRLDNEQNGQVEIIYRERAW